MDFEIDQFHVWQTVHTILQDAENIDARERPAIGQRVKEQWRGAIAALECLLREKLPAHKGTPAGLILSSPSLMFDDHELLAQYQFTVFTPKKAGNIAFFPFLLPSANADCNGQETPQIFDFPLFPNDPLQKEQFCVVLTPEFSFAMALGQQNNTNSFKFSFDPAVIEELWQMLQWRMALTQPFQFQTLKKLWLKYAPVAPDYRLVSRFSQLMLRSLSESVTLVSSSVPETKNCQSTSSDSASIQPELELLQAFTHEIRTPLTTIRTMTKLLLKKKKQLTQDIVRRIETIEQECNEQIQRMELIFRAAELETPSPRKRFVQLVPISLDQLFCESIPRWQKQAQRRNVNLDVVLPKKLPQVVSDPAMLDQVLSGLIEAFTRRLPTGSEVQILVSTAGEQLKLEVQSHGLGQKCLEKAIGQLLIFQPETGSLSLNLEVTKNLFHALGGKLTIRQRSSGEESFAIFLPLGNNVATSSS